MARHSGPGSHSRPSAGQVLRAAPGCGPGQPAGGVTGSLPGAQDGGCCPASRLSSMYSVWFHQCFKFLFLKQKVSNIKNQLQVNVLRSQRTRWFWLNTQGGQGWAECSWLWHCHPPWAQADTPLLLSSSPCSASVATRVQGSGSPYSPVFREEGGPAFLRGALSPAWPGHFNEPER